MQDADKAAALKVYVGVRAKALLWQNANPDGYAKAYLQDVQGLGAADAKDVVAVDGKKVIPATWDNSLKRLQATADLLAEQQDRDKLVVTTLVDRRFEPVETAAAGADVVRGDAA